MLGEFTPASDTVLSDAMKPGRYTVPTPKHIIETGQAAHVAAPVLEEILPVVEHVAEGGKDA